MRDMGERGGHALRWSPFDDCQSGVQPTPGPCVEKQPGPRNGRKQADVLFARGCGGGPLARAAATACATVYATACATAVPMGGIPADHNIPKRPILCGSELASATAAAACAAMAWGCAIRLAVAAVTAVWAARNGGLPIICKGKRP